jgi:signal transduction histidine kinase/ActR/RegA family two-component response regulator/HAMP domain-containing protein
MDRVVASHRRLLILARVSCGVVVLAAASLLAYWRADQVHTQEVLLQREVKRLAQFSAEHLRLTLSNVEKQARVLARAVERRPPGPDFDGTAIHELARDLDFQAPEIGALWVTDRNGTILADSLTSPPSLARVNATDREYFRHFAEAVVPSRAAYVASPIIGRVTGRWTMTLSIATFARDGGFGGVIAAAIDIDYLNQIYGGWRPTADFAVTLLDSNRRVIYVNPFDVAKLNRAMVLPPDDRTTISAVEPITAYDFTVMVTAERRSLEDDIARNARWVAVAGALATGLILFLWLLSERAIRRASALAELAAQRYQSSIEARAEREALYDQVRGALDALPTPFLIVDRNDRIVLWNKAWELVTGLGKGSIRRGTAYRRVLDDAVALGLIPEALEDPQGWIDNRIATRRQPGGSVVEGRREGRWFMFLDFPTPEGGVVGLRLDVTDLKRAVSRAEQAELLLHDALDSMTDGVMLLDGEDRLIKYNMSVARNYPNVEDFVLGDTITEIARRRIARGYLSLTERHLSDINAARRKLRYGDAPLTFEQRRSDGHWTLTRQRRMASGGIISITTDVTELREAQYLAVQAETVLREAINAMTDGWLLWNADDKLVTFNEPAVRLLRHIVDIETGMGAERFVGPLHKLIVEEPSRERPRRSLADLQAERHSPGGLRCECRTPGGTWLSLREQPTRSGWTVSILSDVSYHHRVREEIDRAREAAERYNEAKTRFLATASHDLRQPVHAITLLVDALAKRVQDRDERGIVGAVSESLRSLREMFNTLLYVARLDAGRLEANQVPLRVGDLLDRLGTELAPIANQTGLRLRTVATSAVVVSDPVLLESILRNFIGNACKFTERGGVVVGCRRRGRDIRIEVWDSGPGIPADELDAIFDDFRRLPDPSRRPVEGMGLGLSIARRLADLLGHSIAVHSRQGQGSCFSVTLPLAADAAAAPKAGTADLADIRNAHMLVVDDDPVIVAALSTALEARGARVDGFSHVDDVLDWLRAATTPPDYLLVDLELGDQLNGIDLVHRMTAHFRRVPAAVVLTGSTAAETAELLAEEDMIWLAKPVDVDMIIEALGRAARRVDADAA